MSFHGQHITLKDLTVSIGLAKNTMGLFTIPMPPRQREYLCMSQGQARVLDNPLEDHLRNYVAWGRLEKTQSKSEMRELEHG